MTHNLTASLERAIQARAHLLGASEGTSAIRLFNGFTEGEPNLSVDVYGGTLLFHNRHPDATAGRMLVEEAQTFLLNQQAVSTRIHTGIVKSRTSKIPAERRGALLFGNSPDTRIKEHGIWYAVDLQMTQDAGFYLDTSILRKWLIDNLCAKTVLNTFAYTGSLGIAATAGGARRVVQLDRSQRFLDIAKESCRLNGYPANSEDFIAADFFPAIGMLKRAPERFDCVILDPPFFSLTSAGRVDLEYESARLINKVRPLIHDGGVLITINNALFVSGEAYMNTLSGLCSEGFLRIREIIPIPQSSTGYHGMGGQVTDPAPFNHSTKIAIMDVHRKEDRR